MIDNDKYIDLITNNEYFTECQKKEFLYLRANINIQYVDKSSNKQFSTFINNINCYNNLGKISILLNVFCNNNYIVKKIIDKIIKNKNITDKQLCKYILNKLKSSKEKYKSVKICYKNICNKWDYMFQNLFLTYNARGYKTTDIMYLDYGCGNGKKTLRFAKHYNVNKKNIYGCDIKSWGPYEQMQITHPFNFKYITKDGRLDFPDNTFDLVTCFFVLHHVETLDNTLKELKRVIKPDGILLLLEHNALTYSDILLLDIQHLLYEIIFNKNYKYFDNPQYAQYYNYMEWDYFFKKYDFKYTVSNFLFEGVNNNIRYDSAYYVFYKNIK